MREEQLQYIWSNRLFETLILDGQEIDVIDVGTQNSYNGADFQMARISAGGLEWVGTIEIHERSSMWQQHGHDKDSNYNSVILHVVLEHNVAVYNADGRLVPTAVMTVDEEVLRRMSKLDIASKSLRCMPELSEVPNERLRHILDDLLWARQSRKLDVLKGRSNESNVNAIFYQTLMRYMGAHQNNESMELVAQSLPYLFLKKHSGDIIALEAMLLGQAGLIQEEPRDEYEQRLLAEYIFYKEKFSLTPRYGIHFGYLRLRPPSYPSRMLGIVAQIIHHESDMLAAISTLDKKEIKRVLSLAPSEYWRSHIAFGHEQKRLMGGIGAHTLKTLIINVIIPTAYYYAQQVGEKGLAQKAMEWLGKLSAEDNQYVKLFEQNGLRPRHAADSQALLELYHTYCIPYKCLSCPMASEIFRCFRNSNR